MCGWSHLATDLIYKKVYGFIGTLGKNQMYIFVFKFVYTYTHTYFQLKDWFSKWALWVDLGNPWGHKWLRSLVSSYRSASMKSQRKPVSFSVCFVDSTPAVYCSSLSVPQVQMPQRWVFRQISHHSQRFHAGSLVQGDQIYGTNLTIHM